MLQTPNSFHRSTPAHVLARFVLRLLILAAFAATGTRGYAETLQALLAIAVLVCVVFGTIRAEPPLGRGLTHFDEATAYATISLIVRFVA
jgi:hypothetical protein